jgi:MFS family permease
MNQLSARTLGPALICIAGLLEAAIYGYSYPFYTLNLEERGFSASWIGLNATIGALGVFAIGPFVPALIQRFGYRAFATVCFLIAAAAFASLLAADRFGWLWFISRAALGVALGSLWILTEAWLNQLADDSERGRLNAVFQMLYSIGFMAGPGLTLYLGVTGLVPIMLLITVALLGAAAVFAIRPANGEAAEEHAAPDWTLAWQARGLLLVAVLTGLVETALYTLLPIYGSRVGLDHEHAMGLLLALSLGAITMALPLGWAADRYNRRLVLVLTAWVASASLALLAVAGDHALLAWAACYAAGGTIIGLYSLSLILLGASYTGGALAVVASSYSMAYAAGCALGGALGGLAVDTLGPVGLPAGGAVLLGLFALARTFALRPAATHSNARQASLPQQP